jgi:hypothetical protein
MKNSLGIIASSQTWSSGSEVGGGIVAASADSGNHRSLATIETASPHGIKVGQRVLVTDVSVVFDGTWTVTAVTSTEIYFYLNQHSTASETPTGHLYPVGPPPKKTPDQFAGLVAWYSDTSGIICASNGRVTDWFDGSGNGNHITASGNQRPTLTTFDGHLGVNFGGGEANRYLYGNIPELASLVDVTIIVVGATYSDITHSGMDQVAVSIQGMREIGMEGSNGQFNWGGSISNVVTGGNVDGFLSMLDGSTYTVSAIDSAYLTTLSSVNGGGSEVLETPPSALPAIGVSFPDGPDITVGRDKVPFSGPLRKWHGDIYEIIIYAGTVDSFFKLELWDYIERKYNLGLAL